jgi:hypothetical protein
MHITIFLRLTLQEKTILSLYYTSKLLRRILNNTNIGNIQVYLAII